MYKPYTYCLYHVPTGKKYYGVQHGKNANPENLWVNYFSSSKDVKILIQKYGKDSFVTEVRKTFADRKSAILWEKQVLKRLKVLESNIWLNKHVPGERFHHAKPHTEESNAKNRNAHLGRKFPPRSKEWCENIRKAKIGSKNPNFGKSPSPETIQKRSETNKIVMKEWWRRRKVTIEKA